jgi:rSAM/selenodomain-associated transferase 1
MRRQAHLVVMARDPRLGRVKRRLAADIGPLEAWRFYRWTGATILRRLGAPALWRCWLALTPEGSRGAPWGTWRRGWEVIGQGRGDLGARMSRLLRTLPPGPVVIVGSDIPDLGAAQVARAFGALGRHDWVFGPAPDGGYWLIGARRRPALRLDLAGVRWSSDRALADTLEALEQAEGGALDVAFLEQLVDVDRAADLAALRRDAP